MRSQGEKTEQVRLRIPTDIKQRLDSIARNNGIKFNSVLLLLIDSLLRRKPDLFDVLDNSTDLVKIKKELKTQHMKMLAAYNMMSLHFSSQDRKYDSRCKVFLAESEAFISKLSEQNDK